MKKLLALILSVVLLCSVSTAMAENLTDKPINFAEFTFGQTLGQVRATIWVESISFFKRIKPTRILSDICRDFDGILYDELGDSAYISVRLPEREIAGHRGSVEMYFTYPSTSRADNDAVLYAGVYNFFEHADSTFNDLKTKLTTLYGAPWAEGSNAADIFGAFTFDEDQQWRRDEWSNLTARMQDAQYVVWKSSANGGMMVLKYYNENGDWARAELCYLWPEADQYFDAMDQSSGSSANDMQGL